VPRPQRWGKAAASRGIRNGYRSGLEDDIARDIGDRGLPIYYEVVKIPFLQPEKKRTYSPDFVLPNGIVIETKGQFTTDDRQKHLWVREQHPDLDLRFIFTRSKTRLGKQSRTTYADWCEGKNPRKVVFLFADKQIPEAWFLAPGNERSINVLQKLGMKL